ncbi:hypothetical protein, partial [Asticcacaulis sp.]|uniref:hypothetical protein n=1 Tax=Asticcacaulis sp. TaxID=1872648 RepID=UPI002639EAA2
GQFPAMLSPRRGWHSLVSLTQSKIFANRPQRTTTRLGQANRHGFEIIREMRVPTRTAFLLIRQGAIPYLILRTSLSTFSGQVQPHARWTR